MRAENRPRLRVSPSIIARRDSYVRAQRLLCEPVERILAMVQNDEWAVQRRYISLETLAPMDDAAAVRPPWAAEGWRSYTTSRNTTVDDAGAGSS